MTAQLSGTLLSRFKQLRQWQTQQSSKNEDCQQKENTRPTNLSAMSELPALENEFSSKSDDVIYRQAKKVYENFQDNSFDSGANYSEVDDEEKEINDISIHKGFSLHPEFLKVQKHSPLARALNDYASSEEENISVHSNERDIKYVDNQLDLYSSEENLERMTDKGFMTTDHEDQNGDLPFDEQPIKSNPGYVFTTFEELLEKKLHDETMNSSNAKNNNSNASKHPFLKKRSGTQRYFASKRSLNKDNGEKFNSHPTNVSKKAYSNQVHNKDIENDFQSEDQPSSGNIEFVASAVTFSQRDSSRLHADESDEDRDDCQSVTSSVVESSFQQMIEKYIDKEEIEEVELEEFEQLEYEAALLLRQKQPQVTRESQIVARDVHHSLPSDSLDYLQKTSVWMQSNQLSNVSRKQHLTHIPAPDNGANTSNSLDDTLKETTVDYNFDDENSWHSVSSDTIHGESFKWNSSSSSDSSVVEMNTVRHILPLTNIIKKTRDNTKEITQSIEVSKDKPIVSVITSPGNDKMSLADSKLAELDVEIKKFREETANLKVVQIEIEEERKKLSNERQSFFAEMQRREEDLQKCKDEEMGKLSREKRLFNRHQKAIASMPSKIDRNEIETLKTQIKSLEEDLKTKQSRWNLSSSRYQTRIRDLEENISQQKEQIKILEYELIPLKKTKQATKKKRKNFQHQVKHSLDSKLDESTPIEDELHKDSNNVNFNERITITENTDLENVNNSYNSKTRHERLSYADEAIPEPSQQPTPTDSFRSSPKNNNHLSITSNNKDTHDHPDGKIEEILSDGSRVVSFPNGTKKTVSENGQRIVVSFFNGDVKRLILPEETIMYYYAESKTSHTTYKDGTEIVEFPNGQVEKHYADGSKEITFPDKSVKHLCLNGDEKIYFPDGTLQLVNADGTRHITFPNGQTETHTSSYKRREFPDGTIKTIYEDGRQETRYSNGRLRVKDSRGVVIIDTMKQ